MHKTSEVAGLSTFRKQEHSQRNLQLAASENQFLNSQWKVRNELERLSCILLLIIWATQYSGFYSASPVAPRLKKHLGFPLNDRERGRLRCWSEASDGSLFIDFEGSQETLVILCGVF
jgi:hypothetical protein